VTKPAPQPAPIVKQPVPPRQASPARVKKPTPSPRKPKEHEQKVIQPLHDLHEPLVKKNISSEALEQQEFNQIADELRKNLGDHSATPQTAATPQAIITPQTQENNEEPLPKLKPITARPAHTDENDTIAIDQDGNLIYKKTEE
jgi:hypothetical protein